MFRHDHKLSIASDTRDPAIEFARTDPRDLALRMVRSDVDQTSEQQRFAQTSTAMRRPGARWTEPTQPRVVAIVGGKPGVRAGVHCDVDAR